MTALEIARQVDISDADAHDRIAAAITQCVRDTQEACAAHVDYSADLAEANNVVVLPAGIKRLAQSIRELELLE